MSTNQIHRLTILALLIVGPGFSSGCKLHLPVKRGLIVRSDWAMEINRTPWIGCDSDVGCKDDDVCKTESCDDTLLENIGDALLGTDQPRHLGYGPPGQPPFVNPTTGQPVPGLTMSGYPNMGYPPIGYAPTGYSPGYPQPYAMGNSPAGGAGMCSPGSMPSGTVPALGGGPNAHPGGAVPAGGAVAEEEEDSAEEEAESPTSMMPYPKFHPVPTRSIFHRDDSRSAASSEEEEAAEANRQPPVRRSQPQRQGMNYQFRQAQYPSGGYPPPYGGPPYYRQGLMNPYQARPYFSRTAYPNQSFCRGPYCPPNGGASPYASPSTSGPPKPPKTKAKKKSDSKKTTRAEPARSRLMLASRQTSPLARSPQRVSQGEPNPYAAGHGYYR